MIVNISFDDIYDVWVNKLWPKRHSPIEPTSAMNFLGGYDINNMSYSPSFFGYMFDNKLVGVNSGHMCSDNSYRSRGLYVEEDYRRQGIGVKLLLETVNQAKKENAIMVWSLPRKTSYFTYNNAGFVLASDWFATETSDFNAYVKLQLNT